MPRRNNQSSQANASRRNAAGMSHNSDKDLKCRDTTLGELQSMFSTSLDPEVVQLILTESNYNVDDTIERLLVLSDQDHNKGQPSQRPDIISQSGPDLHMYTSSSSLPGIKREKSPLSVEEKRTTTCEQDWGCFGTSKSAAMVSINSDTCTSSPIKTESLHVSPFVLSFGNPAAFTKYAMENSVEQTAVKSNFGEKSGNQCNIQGKNSCSQAQNPLICTPSLFVSSRVLNPGNSQIMQLNTPPRLYGDSKNTLILESSGLPEFPDTISQQYKELGKENQGHINVENNITSQEFSNTDNCKSSEITNSFAGQNGFSLPSFGRPGEIKQGQCHEFKESLEDVIKQGTTDGIVSENWLRNGGTDGVESQLNLEAGRNRWHSPSTSVVNTSYSTQQLQNGPRTSSNYLPLGMNSQSLSYTASGQSSQRMFYPAAVQDLSGFNCSTGNRSQNLLPPKNISPPCNLLSKGPVFHPPAVQRQCQPPMYQSRGYLRQDTSTLQPRWRFRPSFQTPWQQAPNLAPWSAPRARGNAPHRYPHRSSQQPYFQFGRGHPPGHYRLPANASPFTKSVKHERLLILMRGLPGSGKSTLAQKLKGERGVVLSTDDFFMKNQRYEFDVALLGEAHEWNQKRARKALEDHISPIIVDNTNSQTWEMKPYVSMAIRHGYHVKFVEPDVGWKWNIRELARRNHHGVDINSIKKMKERYEHNVTVDKVINSERKVNSNTGGSNSDTGKETGPNKAQFGEQELDSGQVKTPATSENRIAERNLNVHEALQGADRNNSFVVEEENEKDLAIEADLNDSMQSTRQSVLNQEHGQYPSPKPQRVRKARDTRSRYIHQNLKVDYETTHNDKCRETGENGDTVSGNDSAGFVESDFECRELLRCSSSFDSREYSSLLCQDQLASYDSHLAECRQSDGHCLHNGRVDAERCLETDAGGYGEEASFLKGSSCSVGLSSCFKTNTSVPCPGFENDTDKSSDDCEDNAVKQRDSSENLCVLETKSCPPPLSFILATAARSKRGLSSFCSVQKPSTATAEADERCEFPAIATEESSKLPVEAVGVDEFTPPPITAAEAEMHIGHHTSDTRDEQRRRLRASAIDLGRHDEYVVEITEAEDEREYQTPAQEENGHIKLSATHIEVEVYDDQPATVSKAMIDCEQTSDEIFQARIKRPVSSIEPEVHEDNSVSVSETENDKECQISAKETVDHIELPAAIVEKEVRKGHITSISEAEERFEHQDLAINGEGQTQLPATGTESDVSEDHATASSEAEEHYEDLVTVKWTKRHADMPATYIESDVYEDHTTAISEAEEHYLVPSNWTNRHTDLPAGAMKAHIYEGGRAAVSEAEEPCNHQTSAKMTGGFIQRSEEHNSEFPATDIEAHDPRDQEQLEQSLLENSFDLVEEAGVKSEMMKKNNFVDSSLQSESGSLENVLSGLEFLVACFPDLGRDHLNILLSINNGNVIKVVDDLVSGANDLNAADRQPSFEGVSIHTQESPVLGDALGFPTQENPVFGSLPQTSAASGQINQPKADTFSASNTQEDSSSQTGFVTINSPHQLDQRQEKENGTVTDPSQATSELEINSSSTRPQHCTPSHTGTFQLTLEPAVAFHLIEMFGPIAGLNLGEGIDDQDLVVDVDNNFARQLYKKWEKTVQVRKGISTSKVGSSNFGSPRSRILRIGNDTRDPRRAAVQSGIKKMSSPFRSPEQQTGTLREIMDEQLALEMSRSENLPEASEQDMATTLKRQKLYAMFPGVDPQALDEVFDVNRHELGPTVEAVKASCNLSAQQVPRYVFAREFSSQDSAYDDVRSQETEEDWSWLDSFDPFKPNSWKESFQAFEAPEYSDYRAETVQHAKQRDECFKKAALAFSKKQGQLAQFYAQQGHLHTEKIKEANARAAALILDRKNGKLDDNTIDLHGLHVSEAIEALEKLLNEKKDPTGIQTRKGCKFLSVVTGRGSHSRGGKARIKPAVLEYLKKYNYRYSEPHPGLVKVFL